jgi:hypothetical protein
MPNATATVSACHGYAYSRGFHTGLSAGRGQVQDWHDTDAGGRK